jgi:flagellar basal body-associated protein FliL
LIDQEPRVGASRWSTIFILIAVLIFIISLLLGAYFAFFASKKSFGPAPHQAPLALSIIQSPTTSISAASPALFTAPASSPGTKTAGVKQNMPM